MSTSNIEKQAAKPVVSVWRQAWHYGFWLGIFFTLFMLYNSLYDIFPSSILQDLSSVISFIVVILWISGCMFPAIKTAKTTGILFYGIWISICVSLVAILVSSIGTIIVIYIARYIAHRLKESVNVLSGINDVLGFGGLYIVFAMIVIGLVCGLLGGGFGRIYGKKLE